MASRQPIKTSSNLSKIKKLNLDTDKKSLMKSTIFHKFVDIENFRECSGTLVAALSKCLNVAEMENTDKIEFQFKNATFSFCAKEVAQVLGMELTGSDYAECLEAAMKKAESNNGKIPDFLECFNLSSISSLKSFALKEKLMTMATVQESDKALFLKLMNLFCIDQILVPSTNYQFVKQNSILLVNAPELVRACNWPQAVFDFLFIALKKTQAHFLKKPDKQHVFDGALPILEVLFNFIC